MTEVDLTTALPITPLADSLLRSVPRPGFEPQHERQSAWTPNDLAPYLGVETLRHLDAPEAESSAIFRGAAVHDLGWMRRIAVRGEDRFRWLSGMVTNAVETLAEGRGAYNLVLNAQGRIQGDATVWHDGGKLTLETTANQVGPLLEHLDRFIIMDDVELAEEAGESAIGLTGPEAGRILRTAGLGELAGSLTEEMMSGRGVLADGNEGIAVRVFRGHGRLVPHYAIWTAVDRLANAWKALQEAGAVAVGSAAVEMLRVVDGVPAYGVDIQSRDLAQETGQDRALNFSKGCYLGQEIVERIRSRGQVHRHLRSLEIEVDGSLDAPAPEVGSELRAAGGGPDSKPMGMLTSVARVQLGAATRIFAIGMVRAEAELAKGPLELAGGTVTPARAVLLKGPPKWD